MLINKIFSATNSTTYEMLTLFYCLHLQIVISMIVKRKKNVDSRLIVKGNLRASTNLSLPSLHNFKF